METKENKDYTIEEIRKITVANQLTFDKAMNIVVEASKRGENICLFANLDANAMTKFIRDGYEVSIVRDPIGYEHTKISW